ncbi:MAG: signal peptidase II [Ruminococcaceae bacterium]|nr:signal peptidase II [Oscillospiraceae bacterium]
MKRAIYFIFIVLLVGVDQLTKYLVLINLKYKNAATVIDGILQFRYAENTGAAFSMLSGNQLFLLIFTAILIIGIIIFLMLDKAENKIQQVSLILIVAGGIGNLIDRLYRGFVIDFIELTFIDYAVFNFADILVTIGAVFLILSVILKVKKEESHEK